MFTDINNANILVVRTGIIRYGSSPCCIRGFLQGRQPGEKGGDLNFSIYLGTACVIKNGALSSGY